MEDQSLHQALQKYLENKATPEEIRRLLAHFHTDTEDQLMQLIMKGFNIDKHNVEDLNPDQDVLNRVYDRLQRDLAFTGDINRQKPVRKIWNFAVAASVILAVSFGGYFLLNIQKTQQIAYFKNDIPPGHDRATLTLANGKKIILTKGLSGMLAQQGNTAIRVNGQSAVVYTAAGANADINTTYNTLSTAVGEQSPYPLVLADGTRVWLDAKSSITFPVAFTGKDRIVKVTGEAYFEVVHNNAQPFKVIVKDQTVEDIGTHFNINAYDDENATTTTLLEGAVKVFTPGVTHREVLLKPGQQSVLKDNAFNITNADIEKTMAWKYGYFRFESENIQSIMLKLSRWYNIDVQYSGPVSDEAFYATSSRYRNISEVLKMLQKTKGVHFKIEGRTVTVMQ